MVFYICGWRSATDIVCQKKRRKMVVGVHGDTFKFLPAPSATVISVKKSSVEILFKQPPVRCY